mmetsp:Transcript_1200/g.3065  ORF Transcript_1200/g.3065 Transcript_1200/m.3065 type:complete len:252 (-) Transcript_1200:180-935(-)
MARFRSSVLWFCLILWKTRMSPFPTLASSSVCSTSAGLIWCFVSSSYTSSLSPPGPPIPSLPSKVSAMSPISVSLLKKMAPRYRSSPSSWSKYLMATYTSLSASTPCCPLPSSTRIRRGSGTDDSPLTTSSISPSSLSSSTLSTLVVPFWRAENCQSIWSHSRRPDSSATMRLRSATVSLLRTCIKVALSQRTKSTSLWASSTPSKTSCTFIRSGRSSSISSSLRKRRTRYPGMSPGPRGARSSLALLFRT